MKRIPFIVCLLAFVSIAAISCSKKETVDSIAGAYLSDPKTASLIIGLYREGGAGPEIHSYGTIKKGLSEKPDGATLYKLGSVGKTFTATTLAYHVVNYPLKVKLDDPINKFFPEGQSLPFWHPDGEPNNLTKITLLNLATHHSSLPDSPPNVVGPPGYTIPKLMEFVGSDRPDYHVRPLSEQPGTKWIYSNTGFGLLGVVMENISNQRYQELLIKVICNELKMPDTRIELSDEQKSRLATGYQDGKAVDLAIPTSPGFYGAGGNYSTMNDMLKYLAWNMGLTDSSLNNLLETLHKPRITTGKDDAWVGLAWQINFLTKDLPQKYIWKDGATTGYATFICFVPETKTGVVILSNATAPGLNLDRVGIDVLRLLNPVK